MDNYLPENFQIRKMARDRLRGNWMIPIIVSILASLLTLAPDRLEDIGRIISFLIAGPVFWGTSFFFLNFIDTDEAHINNLFSGFKYFGKALLTNILISFYVILWSLLFIVPGIIAALKYSQTFYILVENPDLRPNEAISESKRIMEGYKMKLFLLGWSFLGWAILSVLSVGIGFIWLIPYANTTYAYFYKSIRDKGKIFTEDETEFYF